MIPTLAAGPNLLDCVLSLDRQTLRDFEVVIVDNSGRRLVQQATAARFSTSVIENERNVGFGAAVNQAYRQSQAPFLATLNDDAMVGPRWLETLVAAMESRPEIGMCASRIRLEGTGRLDSAGMLIAPDGSSKQRGHLEPAEKYPSQEEVLLPSACAALYRRTMLEEIGVFDEDFFLYCEDTDLGLRARWAGWRCLYVPDAEVEHAYSQTAGRASPMKAYYVERNRLFLLLKNFPAPLLWRAPAATVSRYAWHVVSIFNGSGAAANFQAEHGNPLKLAYIVGRAHCSLLAHAPGLLRKRRAIRRSARIATPEFRKLMSAHSISPRQVAAL